MKEYMRINKEYIIISGLWLHDNNRGTAALGYGAFSFLKEKGMIGSVIKCVNFRYVLNPFRKENRGVVKKHINVQGLEIEHHTVNVFKWEKMLFDVFGILLSFTLFSKYLHQIKFVTAINGGDGFSDIYNTKTFLRRLDDINIAMKFGIPLVILPQTIGPFQHQSNRQVANRILKYADKIYVRDDKFVPELQAMGLDYEQTKDLSYYMRPEPFDIDIKANAVGINVSGLAYSNTFRTFSGQFDNYPYLIDRVISFFQSKNIPVYLIPHSYSYKQPETSNDDMVACRLAYKQLKEKNNVYLVDQDLISPQIKYVISKMSYFIGTRMHANFAAIYTGVPLYGLAYSYKFDGAFKANGVYDSNVSMINNLTKNDCDSIIESIGNHFQSHC